MLNTKKITKITRKNVEPTKVYDFEVKDVHHYLFANGVISHNSYIPMKKMGGGSGPVYSASQIVFLSKKRAKDGDGKEAEHIGSIITCILDKSRFTIERKKVEILLRFDTGLSRYYGLLDLAETFGIVIKGKSETDARKTVWRFPNGQEGKSEKEIYDNPEKFFTKDVLDLIDTKCKDEFLYGNTNHTNIPKNEEIQN